MLNSLKSKKGQFFILSAISLVLIIYSISRYISPLNLIDASEVAEKDENFVFNNIVEKTINTVEFSDNCEDLNYNLGELKSLIEKNLSPPYRIYYIYLINSTKDPCSINFNITLYSQRGEIRTSFTLQK